MYTAEKLSARLIEITNNSLSPLFQIARETTHDTFQIDFRYKTEKNFPDFARQFFNKNLITSIQNENLELVGHIDGKEYYCFQFEYAGKEYWKVWFFSSEKDEILNFFECNRFCENCFIWTDENHNDGLAINRLCAECRKEIDSDKLDEKLENGWYERTRL